MSERLAGYEQARLESQIRIDALEAENARLHQTISDTKILEIAIRVLSTHFDEFITSCMDEHGKPKAPMHKDLAKARGYLPAHCKNAYIKTASKQGEVRWRYHQTSN